MDYGYLLRRVWRITWRYPALWLFGFLASLGFRPRFESWWEYLPPEVQDALADFATRPIYPFVVAAGFLVALLVGLALSYVNALGRTALVDQSFHVESGHTPDVRGGWEEGKRRAWPVFLIILFLGLPSLLLLAVGVLPYQLILWRLEPDLGSALLAMAEVLVCLIPAACLAFLVSIPLSLLQRLAVVICVLEERGPWDSIRHAVTFFRERIGPVLLLWLILFLIRVLVFLAGGGLLGLLAIGLLTALAFTAQLEVWVQVVLFVLVALLLWLAWTLIQGVVESFRSIFWTLGYRQLTGRGRTGAE
jgi:hypothetical protein